MKSEVERRLDQIKAELRQEYPGMSETDREFEEELSARYQERFN